MNTSNLKYLAFGVRQRHIMIFLVTCLTIHTCYAGNLMAKTGTDSGAVFKKNKSEARFGLIIGNQIYRNLQSLRTPQKDSTEIARTLRTLGYQVDEYQNIKTKTEMEAKLEDFKAKVAGRASVLFYFAGHGVQVNGENYLIPTDAVIKSLTDVTKQGFALSTLYSTFKEINSPQNIIILDACRNNVFAPGATPVGWIDGFAPPTKQAPDETIIAYSTDPNKKASDEPVEGNSPYAKAILQYIRQPGLKIEDFFKFVQSFVNGNTGGRQRPWYTSSFSFNNKEAYFKSPVFITGKLDKGDDEITVLVNGSLIMLWTNDGQTSKKINLQNGINTLEIKVYNARTFRDVFRFRPEGWSYRLCFFSITGAQLQCFEAEENLPVSGGKHHGNTFTVAKAIIFYDELTNQINFQHVQQDLWK